MHICKKIEKNVSHLE